MTYGFFLKNVSFYRAYLRVRAKLTFVSIFYFLWTFPLKIYLLPSNLSQLICPLLEINLLLSIQSQSHQFLSPPWQPLRSRSRSAEAWWWRWRGWLIFVLFPPFPDVRLSGSEQQKNQSGSRVVKIKVINKLIKSGQKKGGGSQDTGDHHGVLWWVEFDLIFFLMLMATIALWICWTLSTFILFWIDLDFIFTLFWISRLHPLWKYVDLLNQPFFKMPSLSG